MSRRYGSGGFPVGCGPLPTPAHAVPVPGASAPFRTLPLQTELVVYSVSPAASTGLTFPSWSNLSAISWQGHATSFAALVGSGIRVVDQVADSHLFVSFMPQFLDLLPVLSLELFTRWHRPAPLFRGVYRLPIKLIKGVASATYEIIGSRFHLRAFEQFRQDSHVGF